MRGTVERVTLLTWLSLLGVIGLDFIYRQGLSLPIAAVTDWFAHVGTTFIWVAALVSRATRVFVMAALAATVLIDLDHVPHAAVSILVGHETPAAQLWFFHNLLTVVILIVVGWRLSGRRGCLWLGIAFGVGTHIFRNAASGEGPPLLAPFSMRHVSISYSLYLSVLAGLVVLRLGTSMRLRDSARSSRA